MTGFSPEWLDLREPADHRARNAGIAERLSSRFANAGRIAVWDLGAGTGSSLRALAPWLPAEQHWTLLDHDPDLLAAACNRLMSWADQGEADATGATLELVHGSRRLDVVIRRADLREDLDTLMPSGIDLINGSALIDLVSEAWLDRLVAAATRRRSAILMTLNYAGQETWSPPHPADARVLAAFNAHQQGTKTFGPALGPQATEVLAHKLRNVGYDVNIASCPWCLEAGRDSALMTELARGIAAAVRETGLVPTHEVDDWLEARQAASTAAIAHTDLFACRQ